MGMGEFDSGGGFSVRAPSLSAMAMFRQLFVNTMNAGAGLRIS